MNTTVYDWMTYSIKLANSTPDTFLRVGVVLVSDQNEELCSAYSGTVHDRTWDYILMKKILAKEIHHAHSIYLTIHTLSSSDTFALSSILCKIHIDNIYIGLPDPQLNHYYNDDPMLTKRTIIRYPDELQMLIYEQNKKFFSASVQSIQNSPYYAKLRIGSIVMSKLATLGYYFSIEEINTHKQQTKLAALVSQKYKIPFMIADQVVQNAIAEAFNEKYGNYNYIDDTRSLDNHWDKQFYHVFHKLYDQPITHLHILNVGVGSGQEAIKLFSGCSNITFIDIAPDGLDNIKKQITHATTVVSSADKLIAIPDKSKDLYISLRTYNSSFFNTYDAINEAHRVLKANAYIILSVANGFLCSNQSKIIPGLILPGTEFVDIYRGLYTANKLQQELDQAGFINVELMVTNTEIFISAKAV